MPTYVYACDECGQQFEHFQSFKDAPLDTCICGRQGNVRRVFQPVGIVFKGSGWYINDSRKENAKAEMNSSSKSTSSTHESNKSTQPESKTESKAESKTESKAESTSSEKSQTTASTASAND